MPKQTNISTKENLLFCVFFQYLYTFSCRGIVLYGTFAPTIVVLGIFVYLSWLEGCCGAVTNTETPADDQGACLPPGQIVSESRCIRLAIFIVSFILICTCAVVTLVSTFLPYIIRQVKQVS